MVAPLGYKVESSNDSTEGTNFGCQGLVIDSQEYPHQIQVVAGFQLLSGLTPLSHSCLPSFVLRPFR